MPWYNDTQDYICPHFDKCNRTECEHLKSHTLVKNCEISEEEEVFCSAGYKTESCVPLLVSWKKEK